MFCSFSIGWFEFQLLGVLGQTVVFDGGEMDLRDDGVLLALESANTELGICEIRDLGPKGIIRILKDDIDLLEGAALGLWEAEEGENQRQDGNATKNPTDLKVYAVDHVWDSKVCGESPDDVPGSSHGLRLLSQSRVGNLATKEVRNRGASHLRGK